MKNCFVVIFFFLISSIYSYAQIVYIDVNYILKNSEVGKSLSTHIKEINKKNLISYKEIEDQFLKKEKELLAQRNILEESEFEKKLKKLSKEVDIYRSEKKKSLNILNEIKLDNTKKILKILNPIITNYVEKNSISLVIPKKNIIVGKKNLDITEQIIQLLNNDIKKLKF